MTKTQLAEQACMGPNNLSRIMSPDYGKQTISSLRRIAEALDVALVVRMVPFSHYVDWLSGTKRVEQGLSPKALAVPSFEDEETGGVFDQQIAHTFFPVFANEEVTIPSPQGVGPSLPIPMNPMLFRSQANINVEQKRA